MDALTMLVLAGTIAAAVWTLQVKERHADYRIAFWRDAYIGQLLQNTVLRDRLDQQP